jgi:hypothetical protein
VVLRYCPLEMGGDKIPSAEDIEMFIVCLEQQLVSYVAMQLLCVGKIKTSCYNSNHFNFLSCQR